MLLDERLELCDGNGAHGATVGPGGATLTVTGGATTYIGDIVRLSQLRDIGAGHNLYVCVVAHGAIFVASGSTTLNFELMVGATTTGSAGVETLASGSILCRSLSITVNPAANNTIRPGTVLWVDRIPMRQLGANTALAGAGLVTAMPAYNTLMQLRQVTGATALADGTGTDRRINAFITTSPPSWTPYADAVN